MLESEKQTNKQTNTEINVFLKMKRKKLTYTYDLYSSIKQFNVENSQKREYFIFYVEIQFSQNTV